MNRFPLFLEKRLQDLEASACRRLLVHRSGIDFSSNDYLGFAGDSELQERAIRLLGELPVGSSASRLLRGHLPIYDEAESAAAQFCGREAAVIYASGYQANVGLLSALLRPSDLVFSDQYNHASVIDGIKLSGAEKRIYPHANATALRKLLEDHAHLSCSKWIVTESLFSMDGDLAPLKDLADLAEEFSTQLIVDEAHATGLWGNLDRKRGGGWVQALGLEKRVLATIHPAGKAMGIGGAWVCGDARLKDYLVNFSRSLIFSTAPSPFLPALIRASIEHWEKVGPDRARVLLERTQVFQKNLNEACREFFPKVQVPGLIIPIVVGGNLESLGFAKYLQERGFDVRAIRPPTVPEGSSRLRVTLNWGQLEHDLTSLVDALAKKVRSP